VFSLVGGSTADRVTSGDFSLLRKAYKSSMLLCWAPSRSPGWSSSGKIAVLAVLAGITLSFDQPTRFALIPRLVPQEDLPNAIVLNAIVFNGAATVGPA